MEINEYPGFGVSRTFPFHKFPYFRLFLTPSPTNTLPYQHFYIPSLQRYFLIKPFAHLRTYEGVSGKVTTACVQPPFSVRPSRVKFHL